MKKPLQVLAVLLILGVGAIFGSTVLQVFAWDTAPANPPACDPAVNDGCNAPINVGDKPQFKKGKIGLGTKQSYANEADRPLLDVVGSGLFNSLGITSKLIVSYGTDANTKGKVLTAITDAGEVGWRVPTGGTGGVTPTPCQSGQALSYNGTSYSCVTINGGNTTNPLTTIVNCPSGQFISGFTPAGVRICGTPSTGGTTIVNPPPSGGKQRTYGNNGQTYTVCGAPYGDAVCSTTSNYSTYLICPSGTRMNQTGTLAGSDGFNSWTWNVYLCI